MNEENIKKSLKIIKLYAYNNFVKNLTNIFKTKNNQQQSPDEIWAGLGPLSDLSKEFNVWEKNVNIEQLKQIDKFLNKRFFKNYQKEKLQDNWFIYMILKFYEKERLSLLKKKPKKTVNITSEEWSKFQEKFNEFLFKKRILKIIIEEKFRDFPEIIDFFEEEKNYQNLINLFWENNLLLFLPSIDRSFLSGFLDNILKQSFHKYFSNKEKIIKINSTSNGKQKKLFDVYKIIILRGFCFSYSNQKPYSFNNNPEFNYLHQFLNNKWNYRFLLYIEFWAKKLNEKMSNIILKDKNSSKDFKFQNYYHKKHSKTRRDLKGEYRETKTYINKLVLKKTENNIISYFFIPLEFLFSMEFEEKVKMNKVLNKFLNNIYRKPEKNCELEKFLIEHKLENMYQISNKNSSKKSHNHNKNKTKRTTLYRKFLKFDDNKNFNYRYLYFEILKEIIKKNNLEFYKEFNLREIFVYKTEDIKELKKNINNKKVWFSFDFRNEKIEIEEDFQNLYKREKFIDDNIHFLNFINDDKVKNVKTLNELQKLIYEGISWVYMPKGYEIFELIKDGYEKVKYNDEKEIPIEQDIKYFGNYLRHFGFITTNHEKNNQWIKDKNHFKNLRIKYEKFIES